MPEAKTQELSPELQKIADELKQQEEAAKGTAGEEVSISLETGQVYKGKNWEEVAQKIADAQRSASETIRQQREELERRGEGKPAEATPPAPAGFDSKRYWELMNEDPRRAARYALAADLGVPEEQLPVMLTGAIQTAQNIMVSGETAKFRQDCLDYPATEEAMNKMLERAQTAGRLRKLPSGQEFMTADQMKLTWYELRDTGAVKPLEIGKRGASADGNGADTAPTPPPSLTGGAASTSDPLAAAEEKLMTLPLEQAEALLKQLGMK